MASRITGRTRVSSILGDPVEHIRGSAMLNDFFAEQGVDAAVSRAACQSRAISRMRLR